MMTYLQFLLSQFWNNKYNFLCHNCDFYILLLKGTTAKKGLFNSKGSKVDIK